MYPMVNNAVFIYAKDRIQLAKPPLKSGILVAHLASYENLFYA